MTVEMDADRIRRMTPGEREEFALTGRWSIYWGEPGSLEEMVLEPWDAVSVPAPVMRGFRNVGTGDAFLLALLGGGSPPPIYHDSVTERLRAARHIP